MSDELRADIEERYRSFVGPRAKYDQVSAMQFNILTLLGLREGHRLLDIGCGSLRAGRLLMIYLQPGNYYGIEPEQWLVEEGIRRELCPELVALRKPQFCHSIDFPASAFGVNFDFYVAQSIFSHTSVAQMRTCLGEVEKTFNPTSVFAATFMEGDDNYKGDEWVYPGCVTYTFDFISALGGEFGFACRRIDWPHPNGQTWVVFARPEHMATIPSVEIGCVGKLEKELGETRARLVKLESHPYVRLGLGLRRRFNRLLGR